MKFQTQQNSKNSVCFSTALSTDGRLVLHVLFRLGHGPIYYCKQGERWGPATPGSIGGNRLRWHVGDPGIRALSLQIYSKKTQQFCKSSPVGIQQFVGLLSRIFEANQVDQRTDTIHNTKNSTLTATHSNKLLRTTPHCNTLQYTHCNQSPQIAP
jgi:hypothetical protein